jgi:hypothetical protein
VGGTMGGSTHFAWSQCRVTLAVDRHPFIHTPLAYVLRKYGPFLASGLRSFYISKQMLYPVKTYIYKNVIDVFVLAMYFLRNSCVFCGEVLCA